MATDHKFLSEYMSQANYQPRKMLTKVREAFSRGDFGENVFPIDRKMKFGKGKKFTESKDPGEKGTFFDFLILDSKEFDKWVKENEQLFSADSDSSGLMTIEAASKLIGSDKLSEYIKQQRNREHKKMQNAERVKESRKNK